MLYGKFGQPKDSEVLLCEVTAVNPSSVFVKLIEYRNKVGMIHISEISPGRIRNIRDFVRQGKMIVCKVLSINDRGNVDLSLRRVSEGERRGKNEFLKQEIRAEKILDGVSKELNVDMRPIYEKLRRETQEEYEGIFPFFEDVVSGHVKLGEYFDEKVAGALETAIRSKIKPPLVQIKGSFKIKTYEIDGVERIKKSLAAFKDQESLIIYYAGGGSYTIEVMAEDYKTAEKSLKNVIGAIETDIGTYGEFAFTREKGKKVEG